MQIQSLRIKSYRSWKINDTVVLSEIARDRLRKIQTYDQLRAEGCSEKSALNAVQTSRPTIFRWKNKLKNDGLKGLEPGNTIPTNIRTSTWPRELEFQVCSLRKANPCYGKYKIKTLLKREHGIDVNVSMVGRIISKLIKSGRIRAVPTLLGHRYPKKKRTFNKHAKRWKYGMKGKEPGELVQIDHMSVYSAGANIKHFKAICPVTRIMIARVYSKATSKIAASFLDYLIKEIPFKINSIQVDGGSEFMKDFEQACMEKNIELFVLPPRKPKYNGIVERTNGITRDEFYWFYRDTYDTGTVNIHLKKYQDQFNTHRPHQGLQYLTPMEYYQLNYQNKAA